VNNNLERILKEYAVEIVEGFPVIFPGGFEENQEEFRDGRTSNFDMNLRFLAYEAMSVNDVVVQDISCNAKDMLVQGNFYSVNGMLTHGSVLKMLITR
jgi:hypothetical protein